MKDVVGASMKRFVAITIAVAVVALGCGGEFGSFGETGSTTGGGAGTTTTASGSGGSTTSGSGSGGTTTSPSTSTTTGSGAAGGQGQGGDPSPPCHPSGLADTFEGNAVNTTLWNLQGASDNISVHSGLLHITPKDNVNSGQWTGMVTAKYYDVTGCAVWLAVPSLVKNGNEGFTYLQLYHDKPQAAFKVEGGQLVLTVGDNQITTTYAPKSHLWWRFREDGGTLFLETSPDASSWTVEHSAATPPFINDVSIGLGSVSPSNATNLGEVQMDNLDSLP